MSINVYALHVKDKHICILWSKVFHSAYWTTSLWEENLLNEDISVMTVVNCK